MEKNLFWLVLQISGSWNKDFQWWMKWMELLQKRYMCLLSIKKGPNCYVFYLCLLSQIQCIWKHWWTFRLSENLRENLTVKLCIIMRGNHMVLRTWALVPDFSGLESWVCHLLAEWPWANVTVQWSWVMALSCSNPSNSFPSLWHCLYSFVHGSIMDLCRPLFFLSVCFSLRGILAGPSSGFLHMLVLHLECSFPPYSYGLLSRFLRASAQLSPPQRHLVRISF